MFFARILCCQLVFGKHSHLHIPKTSMRSSKFVAASLVRHADISCLCYVLQPSCGGLPSKSFVSRRLWKFLAAFFSWVFVVWATFVNKKDLEKVVRKNLLYIYIYIHNLYIYTYAYVYIGTRNIESYTIDTKPNPLKPLNPSSHQTVFFSHEFTFLHQKTTSSPWKPGVLRRGFHGQATAMTF